jgi:hypothetical protein
MRLKANETHLNEPPLAERGSEREERESTMKVAFFK